MRLIPGFWGPALGYGPPPESKKSLDGGWVPCPIHKFHPSPIGDAFKGLGQHPKEFFFAFTGTSWVPAGKMVGHLPFACKPSIIQIRNLSCLTLLKVCSCRPSLIWDLHHRATTLKILDLQPSATTLELTSISTGAVTPDSKIYCEEVKMCRLSSGNWFFYTKLVQLPVAGERRNSVVHLQKRV